MMREIIVISIIAAFVLKFSYKRIGDFLNFPKSKLSYATVIVKKRDISETMDAFREVASRQIMRRHVGFVPKFPYYVIFEIENHKEVTLKVPKRTYNSLSIGSTGVLAYRDRRFRKFHVNKSLAEIVNPD